MNRRATSAWTNPVPTNPITTATDERSNSQRRRRRRAHRSGTAACRGRRGAARRQDGRRQGARRGRGARGGLRRAPWTAAGTRGGAGGGAYVLERVRAQRAPLLTGGRDRVLRTRPASEHQRR